MEAIINVELFGTIADIQGNKFDHLKLIDNSLEVDEIKNHFGNNEDINEFDGFFVAIDEGDYTEVYGFNGNIPYLSKDLYKITLEFKP